ncbi:MAG: YbhB/YbcL family Raf kinase inhibitor-like protein [Erythrobacter sp.]|nr:YbhB/YbcL family Raf kinase inhibitor-like protein [Erythrobacter sp.]NCQ64984.1 YbhB/YbcL family Raf kinase inhibitor-like protein [Alphaproteobacteria bacterium]
MTDWLSAVLPASCPANPELAIARFATREAIGRNGFTLSSPAFKQGAELDPCFTADEEDAVAPPMEWTSPPKGAEEMVLVVQDASSPDATCHWLVWGLTAQHGKLLEGEAPPRTGKNDQGNSEWLLPRVDSEGEPHCFVFQLFALDLPIALLPGAGKAELYAAMEGHVIAASVLTATYSGSEEDDLADLDDAD